VRTPDDVSKYRQELKRRIDSLQLELPTASDKNSCQEAINQLTIALYETIPVNRRSISSLVRKNISPLEKALIKRG
jgi:hypothetical protein